MKFEFSVDRGGTFTDIFCVIYDEQGKMTGVDRSKLLSEDSHYEDAISEGIRRVISRNIGEEIKGQIPSKYLVSVRIGTTIGTNALLEKKGARTAVLMTRGFRDLLKIGNQTRPKIFELNISKFGELYEEVREIEERVEAFSSHEKSSDEEKNKKKFRVREELNKEHTCQILKEIKDAGIESIAVCLMHSYEYPDHELEVEKLAKEVGFKYVFLSHKSSNKIGYLARSSTCLLDAYLYPVIQKYFERIMKNFENSGQDVPMYIMQSDGALAGVSEFTGSKAILSGPAGGVSGFSKTTLIGGQISKKVIGFDMGGTSTDVSTFEGSYEMNYESEIAGAFVSTPHLDINTVAAGGGSCLTFASQMLRVGPESAGSNPGPVCYGKGGLLAVTDVNLILGRVIPEYFPNIFGPNQDQPLDKAQSQERFRELAKSIGEHEPKYANSSIEEIAAGFIQVANEVMCRPIRALTESRGKDPKDFDLAIFGGAGAQHGCAVASNLGISRVFVHKYSSILSAYGIFLSDIVKESSLYYNKPLKSLDESQLLEDIKKAQADSSKVTTEAETSIYQEEFETAFVMRYNGSESLLTVNRTEVSSRGIDPAGIELEFIQIHEDTFGFKLEHKDILLLNVFVRRKLMRKDLDLVQRLDLKKAEGQQESSTIRQVYFVDKATGTPRAFDTPVYLESNLSQGWICEGPSLVVMNGSSIVVEPGWRCLYNDQQNFELTMIDDQRSHKISALDKDPVILSIFGQRFMSIAEQMGRRLQRTALSTNIKERLDFSCAVFDPEGGLVANAPHLPVHLGSMESTVTYQINTLGDDFREGDVVISNHPKAGGSHLPDITAITPCFYKGKPIFYVASRGHHSDVGGKTPGSMPAFAQNIFEEGVAFKSFKIVESGVFQEETLVDALKHPPGGAKGSRAVLDNVSDLKAQVASNKRGVELLLKLVDEYGLEVVHGYMKFIQEAAEISVRNMLVELSLRNNMKEVDTVSQIDYMDDGTEIALDLTIDRKNKSAHFDFTKSGLEVLGNFNTPDSVVRSAIIYCLRCLVNSDIPLNSGCLKPVKIETKPGSVLNPSETAAIVGGNVTTSQRITDVILKSFKAVADSQGCMNNFTFGDDSFGYYETIAGGSGAGPTFDGSDSVQVHMTNTRITDPEILESRCPVLLVQFAVRPGSGGQGKHKGGCGVIREFEFKTDLQVSILSERRVFAPEGICGGKNGSKGINILTYPDGREVYVGGKCSIQVEKGTKFKILTPGGGGYGDPTLASLELNSSNMLKSSTASSRLELGSLNAYAKAQEQS